MSPRCGLNKVRNANRFLYLRLTLPGGYQGCGLSVPVWGRDRVCVECEAEEASCPDSDYLVVAGHPSENHSFPMQHSQPDDQKALYANMMEEVNARLETIFVAAQGGYRMHEMLAEEFCYFQLRMLCEAIACACLIAHGDLTGNVHKLRNQWSADTIIRELTKLHSDFYPKPRIVRITEERIEIAHKMEGFLARAEFLRLYGSTHSRNHRGSLKDMSNRPPYAYVNFTPIVAWARKIEELLNDHLIQSPDETHSWLVLQKATQTGGHPLVVDIKK